MKLRNKKTGEIVERVDISIRKVGVVFNNDETYDTLTELNAEWEDAPEEPNEYYCIDWTEPDGIYKTRFEDARDAFNQEIGNYFDTREEAGQAVEKLKAWKRLKDNGMIKYSFHREKRGIDLDFYTLTILAPRDKDSLDLLFGGEE